MEIQRRAEGVGKLKDIGSMTQTKQIRMSLWLVVGTVLLALVAGAQAGENLRLNPHLDYSSDSQDGPLITGEHMDDGAVEGKPNYIIFFGEG